MHIADLAAKRHLLRGDDDAILVVRKCIPVTSARLMGITAAGANPTLMTPSAFMCRSWPDRGSCTHATPMPLVISVLHAHFKSWSASIAGYVWKPAPNGGYDAVLTVRHEMPLAKHFAGLHAPSPLPNSPGTTLFPCRSQLEEILTFSSSRTA